jgi:type III secretory pathway component EscU
MMEALGWLKWLVTFGWLDLWEIATSQVVLLLIGALVAASAVVGWFPLLKWFPVIGDYVRVARLVFVLSVALLAFLTGFRVADNRAERAQLQNELNWKNNEVEQQRQSAEDAERLKKEAEARADQLSKKVGDYEDFLSKQPVGTCAFDDADIERLRGIAR